MSDREVWSASTYVNELRRRRDESRSAAAVELREEEQLRRSGDLVRARGRCDEHRRLAERAAVYEECAALCELTSDRRAWPPVFDAMARVISVARRAVSHAEGAFLDALGPAVAELDAALDARTTLPEVVETEGHRGCKSERAPRAGRSTR